jgi:toxin CptA
VYTLMREIEPKPSRLLGLLLAGMAALALGAIGHAAVPAALQLGSATVVLGLAAVGWRRASQLAPLRLMADGRLQGLDEAGEWRDVEVLGDSFVSPTLVVLRYRMDGQSPRSLVLLPDSADADELRRLRVSLRWARHTRSDTSSPGAD